MEKEIHESERLHLTVLNEKNWSYDNSWQSIVKFDNEVG